MSPAQPTPKNSTKTPEPKSVTKTEIAEASTVALAAPVETTSVTTPKETTKKDEGTKPFTVTIDSKMLRILKIVARSEGSSVSDVVIDAIYKANLKERAKKALAALAAELDG